MNYRKWPAQSVLWLKVSVSFFAIYGGSDLYRWKVQGKPTGPGELVDSFLVSIVAGWAATLSSNARAIGLLTLIVTIFVMLICGYGWEQKVHLSPLADAARDRTVVLFPLLVAVSAMLLWRRRERLREIRTMR